jgi:hypothetical protein
MCDSVVALFALDSAEGRKTHTVTKSKQEGKRKQEENPQTRKKNANRKKTPSRKKKRQTEKKGNRTFALLGV